MPGLEPCSTASETNLTIIYLIEPIQCEKDAIYSFLLVEQSISNSALMMADGDDAVS